MTDLIPHDIAHAELIASRVAIVLQNQPTIVPEYLNAKDAAVFLGMTEKLLESRRYAKSGPRYTKHGPRIVRYSVIDLRKWMEAGHVLS